MSIRANVGKRDKYGTGVPLLDAARHPCDPNILYVVPVRAVDPCISTSYLAAAKLRVYGSDGDYVVEAVYGVHPTQEPHQGITQTSAGSVTFNPDRQHLREIEVDHEGRVYVLTSTIRQTEGASHPDHRGLVYDKNRGGVHVKDVRLEHPDLLSPTAMVLSPYTDQLYVATVMSTGVDLEGRTTEVYRYSVRDPNHMVFETCLSVQGPQPTVPEESLWKQGWYVSAITSMTVNPDDGTLYVTGFTAPKFTGAVWMEWEPTGLFTTPMLAIVEPDFVGTAVAEELNGPHLPLSMAWLDPDR